MNETKLMFNLGILKHFINNSLGLSYARNKITGFELVVSLLESTAYNSYVEIVSNKADILYLRCKESLISMMEQAYLDYIKESLQNSSLMRKKLFLHSIIPTRIFMEMFKVLIFMAGQERMELLENSNFLHAA